MDNTNIREKIKRLTISKEDTMEQYFRNPEAKPISEYTPRPILDQDIIEEPIIGQDITTIANLLERSIAIQEEQVILLNNMTKTLTNETPSGTYFDSGSVTIDVASPDVLDADTIYSSGSPLIPGYTQVLVHDIMRRNSNRLSIINDGPGALYVRASDDGNKFSQIEIALLFGEARTFFNVYELRIRSPDATNQFRATEYDYWIAYSAPIPSVVTNRTNFNATSVAAPVLGAQLPNIVIPDGFYLSIRSTVGNGANNVYVSRTLVGATTAGIPGNRVTLAEGDTAELNISNANLVYVAGAAGGLGVDLLVEQ